MEDISMNRKLFVLLLILTLVFPLAASAKPAADVSPAGGVATAEVPEDLIHEVVLDAVADTWVGAWAPDTNYGDKHEMYVRSGGIEGGLLKFDLSAIPVGATVIDDEEDYELADPGDPNRTILSWEPPVSGHVMLRSEVEIEGTGHAHFDNVTITEISTSVD